MSLTISYDNAGSSIKGVYTPNILTMSDTTSNLNFDVILHYDNKTRSLKLYQDGNYSARIDVNKIMQDAFTSDVVNNEYKIIPWHVYVNSNYGANGSSIVTDTSNWIINGIKPSYDNYLLNPTNRDRLALVDSSCMFLNENRSANIYWSKSLYTQLPVAYKSESNNELTLNWLSGSRFMPSTDIGNTSRTYGLKIDVYADVSTYHINQSVINPISDPEIRGYDISIVNLGLHALAGNIYKYVVKDVSNGGEYTVNVKDPNLLNDKYFRVGWINSNGVNEYFNFDYNYQKSIKKNVVEYTSLDSNFSEIQKQCNNKIDEIFEITTGWINENDSLKLESLWKSPSVKVSVYYTTLKEFYHALNNQELIKDKYIVLDVKNVDIKRRRNSKLINYTVSFVYKSTNNIQIH